MLARVDGQVVAADALWWPAMNFGQFRWDALIGAYELEFRRSEFVRRMELAYRQCIGELQADDALVPDQLPSPLREANYPPLAQLVDRPAAFREAVAVFLWHDLLGEFIPRPLSAASRFMVNSIDSVSASAAVVAVRGRGYHGAPGFAA